MRILVTNDGCGDAGGVQSYLDAVVPELAARGHTLAMLHRDTRSGSCVCAPTCGLPVFSVEGEGSDLTLARVTQWAPDLCFANNWNDLDVERRLLAIAPVVKFMQGYFGTCIGGQKMLGWPTAVPCDRVFGTPCFLLYLPRHCGQLSVAKLVRQYRWATDQRVLFGKYAALMVASEHMRDEYVRNGVDLERVHVNPLAPACASTGADGPSVPALDSAVPAVAFFGRMTTLKGGDLLIRAAADASRRIGKAIRLTMVGDGPQRGKWEALALRLGVPCAFVGWQRGDDRWRWLRGVHLLAVPSTWPEPFGLVGLEAAAFGVPAIAFDVGGIREWLRPGENGYLVGGDPPRASALADGLVEAFTRPAELESMRRRAWTLAREMSLSRHLDRLEPILADAARTHAHPAGR
jgi:glycosyltransferase involved in cell wall biosynthesis